MESTQKSKEKIYPSFIEVFAISVLVSICCLFIYDTYFAQKIAVFDEKDYKKQQGQLYLKGKYSEENHQRNLKAMRDFVEAHPNLVFLNQDVVLSNGKVIKITENPETGEENGKK